MQYSDKIPLLLLMIFLMGVAPSLAQEVRLDGDQKTLFQQRTLDKINEFQAQLSILASKTTDALTKQIYSESILDLFINKGVAPPPPCPAGSDCLPVMMEVSSVRSGQEKKTQIPIKRYLRNLAKLPYSEVHVTAAKSCHVSSLYERGKDEFGQPIYAATATYYQEFVGFVDGKPAYRDVTQKTVEVEVRYTTDLEGSRWIILLGDISVEDTTS